VTERDGYETGLGMPNYSRLTRQLAYAASGADAVDWTADGP
jgi:hypothetical protein